MNLNVPNSPAAPEDAVLSKSDENLVWLDCEMSGLDPEKDKLLEIAVVVTGPHLTPRKESAVWVLHQSDAVLNGMDAWRRLVRQVDHGRGIRLEMLRREVQDLHTKPIKSLEAVEEGVAIFENTMTEYARAGGRESTDAELKSDLLRILPREIRELLLWHSTDVGVSFYKFRDTVVAQTAAVLMNRGGTRGVNAVGADEDRRKILKMILEGDGDEEEMLEDIVGAVAKFRGRGARVPAGERRPAARTPAGERRPAPPTGERRPAQSGQRRCPNCSGTHKETRCPHPDVGRDGRKCFNCNQTGHTAAACPKPKSVRSVEEQSGEPQLCMAMSLGSAAEGFTTQQRKGSARWNRPTPSRVTVADCLPEALRSGQATAAAYAGQPRKAVAGQPRKVATGKGAQVIRGRCSAEDIDGMSSEKFGRLIQQEIAQIEADEIAKAERILEAEHNVIKCLQYEDDYDYDDDHDHNHIALMAMDVKPMDIEVAIDSGSVVNVANPRHLPADAVVLPNTSGRHFNGANASHIENYGTCLTRLQDKKTNARVDCDWSVGEVTRPLHAVCKLTGTVATPKHDVLFTAGRAVVVPHGHVEDLLTRVKPLMQYDRKGDLFVAKLTMSTFARQITKP